MSKQPVSEAKLWHLHASAFCGGVVGVLLLFVLIKVIAFDGGALFPRLRAILLGSGKEPTTILDELQVLQLIKDGRVVTGDQFFGALSNFYGAIIAVLIGLFALFAFTSLWTIQRLSRAQLQAQVEENTEKTVAQYFQSNSFTELFNERLKTVQNDVAAETNENFANLGSRIDDLGDQLQKIAARLAELDEEESEANPDVGAEILGEIEEKAVAPKPPQKGKQPPKRK